MIRPKIDKGIPIPKIRRGRPGLYPFSEMQIGDSFFLPMHGHKLSASANSWKAHRRRQKEPGGKWKFETREVKENGIDGTRIWRVK